MDLFWLLSIASSGSDKGAEDNPGRSGDSLLRSAVADYFVD